MIELSELFENILPSLSRFGDLEAELRAIRSREKAMSVFSFERSQANETGGATIVNAALDLGLLVGQYVAKIDLSGGAHEIIYIFILNPEEIWRIPSYLATRKSLHSQGWSEGMEVLESRLLGYSDEDISMWMTHKRNSRAGWSGQTIYLLMSERQRRLIAEVGGRYLEPNSIIEDIVVFFSRSRSTLKSNILDLIPAGTTIGRVAVRRSFFNRIFGDPASWSGRDVVSSSITKDVARLLNMELESNFQFIDDGWR